MAELNVASNNGNGDEDDPMDEDDELAEQLRREMEAANSTLGQPQYQQQYNGVMYGAAVAGTCTAPAGSGNNGGLSGSSTSGTNPNVPQSQDEEYRDLAPTYNMLDGPDWDARNQYLDSLDFPDPLPDGEEPDLRPPGEGPLPLRVRDVFPAPEGIEAFRRKETPNEEDIKIMRIVQARQLLYYVDDGQKRPTAHNMDEDEKC